MKEGDDIPLHITGNFSVILYPHYSAVKQDKHFIQNL
jgi:hypothetical protein